MKRIAACLLTALMLLSLVSCGVTQAHLWREYQKALAGEPSPDCRAQCTGCGALCLMKGGKCDA